jgi:hypothetical protein
LLSTFNLGGTLFIHYLFPGCAITAGPLWWEVICPHSLLDCFSLLLLQHRGYSFAGLLLLKTQLCCFSFVGLCAAHTGMWAMDLVIRTEQCLCSGIIIIKTRRKQNGREQIWHLVLRGPLWNDNEKCTQPIKCKVLMKWEMRNKIRKRVFKLRTNTRTHSQTHSNTHFFQKGVNTNTFCYPDGSGSNPPLYSVLWIPLKYLCLGAKVSQSHAYYMSHFCPISNIQIVDSHTVDAFGFAFDKSILKE